MVNTHMLPGACDILFYVSCNDYSIEFTRSFDYINQEFGVVVPEVTHIVFIAL